MNFRYPVYLDLTGKRCLVTGEGYEVAGKVKALAEAGAAVRYVNETAVPEIQDLVQDGLILWARRNFVPADLDGCFLVITSRPDNADIFRMAEERGILCNAVDDPKNCRFSHGSIHRQGELTIGISTNGVAPAIAVRLKEKLQREVGPEYKELLDLLTQLRGQITAEVEGFERRKDLWYRIVDSEALALFRTGQAERATSLVRQMVAEAINST